MAYQELKKRHQDEISAFPLVFAFSNEQLYKGMREKWGLEPTDIDQICSVGAGGYARKSDISALKEMLDRHEKEYQDAIAADKTGEGFIFEMFSAELANHEYTYTYDLSDTLRAVGMTPEEINANPALRNGLSKAVKAAEDWVEEQEAAEASGEERKAPLDETIAEAEEQKDDEHKTTVQKEALPER